MKFFIYSIGILFITSLAPMEMSDEEVQPCPDFNQEAEDLIESFLTKSVYASYRTQTGTSGLTMNDATRLDDSISTHKIKCKQIIAKDGSFDPSDDYVRTTVFYKVGQFYFVPRPITRSTYKRDGVEVVLQADHYLSILDSDLNILGTVAM